MDTQELTQNIKQHPVAVAGFVLALLFGAVYYFRMEAVPKLQEELDSLRAENASISRNENFAKGLDKDTEEITALTSSLDSRVMDADQRANNYRYFYGIETRTGIKMVDLRQKELTFEPKKWPNQRPQTLAFYPIEYSIRAAGNYQQVFNFLNQIEFGKYLVRFDEVAINVGKSVDGDTIELSLQMDVLGVQEDLKIVNPSLTPPKGAGGKSGVMPTKEREQTIASAQLRLNPENALYEDTLSALENNPFVAYVEPVPEAEPVPELEPGTDTVAIPDQVELPRPIRQQPEYLSDEIALEVANRQLAPTGGLKLGNRELILTRFGRINSGQVLPLKIRDLTYNVTLVDVSINSYTLRLNDTQKTFSYTQDSNSVRVE